MNGTLADYVLFDHARYTPVDVSVAVLTLEGRAAEFID